MLWKIVFCCIVPFVVVGWFWASIILGKLADKNIRDALRKMRDEKQND